jgi:hypothetical protein
MTAPFPKEVIMDQSLHFLESFMAKGSDGVSYKICGYERMAPDVPFTHMRQEWQPTGVAEYHLTDGRMVDVERDGTMHIAGTNVTLTAVPRGGATGDTLTH